VAKRYARVCQRVGPLLGVKKWWDYLKAKGPDFGYCQTPTKAILIVKNKILCKPATIFFKNTGIGIVD